MVLPPHKQLSTLVTSESIWSGNEFLAKQAQGAFILLFSQFVFLSFTSVCCSHPAFSVTLQTPCTFLMGSLTRSYSYLISCLSWQLMCASNLGGRFQMQFGTPAGGRLKTVLNPWDKTGAAAEGILSPEGRARVGKGKSTLSWNSPGLNTRPSWPSRGKFSTAMGKGW